MEDIKIGRELGSVMIDCSAKLNTNQPLFPADPNRVRIAFHADGQNPYFCRPRGFAGTSINGITLTATNPSILLRIEEYGKLICDDWFADSPGPSNGLTAVLSTLERRS